MPPNWQPNWDDVDFDHAKARAAADACRQAVGALTTVVDGFATAQGTLVTEASWEGRFRDDYDGEHPKVIAEAIDTRQALRDLARAIETAAGEASAEQTRREADRERWRQEYERELQRR
jgi:uncharacterized protein YukE